MECRDCKELVIRYSSEDLPDGDRDLVQAHLGECEECSQYLAQSESLWSLLDEWREIEPRADFISDFWGRVSKEESGFYPGLFTRLKKLKPNWALAGALASILIVGIFTFALIGPDSGYRNYTNNDEQDEMLLLELDNATTRETTEELSIYGPWDNGVEIMKINGNGDMN